MSIVHRGAVWRGDATDSQIVAERGRCPGKSGRRTALFIALGAILAGLLACAGGGSGDAGTEPAGAAESPGPSDLPAPDRGMGERPITERRPFAVGSTSAALVDTRRPTPGVPQQGIAAVPRRNIDLIVLYPTDEGTPPADPGGLDDDRAPPADSGAAPAEGPFPLLVFGHGWNGSGASLLAPASRWASAGYVVALPTFPLSRAGIAVSDDLVHQPGDISFVIDTLLARSADPGDRLAGRIDADRIAVGGHSLGSATVFGFENSCCHDDRVRAIVAISGGPAPYATGAYEATYTTPLLLVHGAADPGVSSAISEAVFAQTPGPLRLLLLDDGDHTSLFGGEDGAILDRVLVAWLDEELGIDPTATDGLEAEVTATGRGSLRSKHA